MISGSVANRLRAVFSLIIISGVLTLLWRLDGEGLVYRYFNGGTALVVMLACTFLFILLMALPFVPGIELGWLLMGAFGVSGIIAAWLGTIAGLTLGFTVVRRMRNVTILQELVSWREKFVGAESARLSSGGRLLQHCMKWQQNHPYLFLLMALNLPGNLVIGGGGGIAWISALTPGTGYRCFIPVVVLATSMVPLLLLTGLLNSTTQ